MDIRINWVSTSGWAVSYFGTTSRIMQPTEYYDDEYGLQSPHTDYTLLAIF